MSSSAASRSLDACLNLTGRTSVAQWQPRQNRVAETCSRRASAGPEGGSHSRLSSPARRESCAATSQCIGCARASAQFMLVHPQSEWSMRPYMPAVQQCERYGRHLLTAARPSPQVLHRVCGYCACCPGRNPCRRARPSRGSHAADDVGMFTQGGPEASCGASSGSRNRQNYLYQANLYWPY